MVFIHTLEDGHEFFFESFGVLLPMSLQGVFAHGVLDEAVDVNRNHIATTRHHARQTRSGTEGILGQFVAQATTGGQTVGTVGDVGEETVPLGVHFGTEFLVVLVNNILAIVHHGKGLYGEGEHLLEAYLVEPFHEKALQCINGFPFGLAPVGIAKILEERIEIRVVVVGDIGERTLEAAVGGRLVDAPDELLESLEDLSLDGAADAAVGGCHFVVQIMIPFGAELNDDIVVERNEVFTKCHRSFALRGEQEGEVGDLSAERLQVVGRAGRHTVNIAHAFGHERIERIGLAIKFDGGRARLVVGINNMVVEVLLVLVGHFGEERLQFVLHALALDESVGGFIYLAFEVGHVLHRHVGVGVGFGGGSRIVHGVAIAVHIVNAFADEAGLLVVVAIKDESLGHGKMFVLHQCALHHVLYRLNRYAFCGLIRFQFALHGGHDLWVVSLVLALKSLADGHVNFAKVKVDDLTISLDNFHTSLLEDDGAGSHTCLLLSDELALSVVVPQEAGRGVVRCRGVATDVEVAVLRIDIEENRCFGLGLAFEQGAVNALAGVRVVHLVGQDSFSGRHAIVGVVVDHVEEVAAYFNVAAVAELAGLFALYAPHLRGYVAIVAAAGHVDLAHSISGQRARIHTDLIFGHLFEEEAVQFYDAEAVLVVIGIIVAVGDAHIYLAAHGKHVLRIGAYGHLCRHLELGGVDAADEAIVVAHVDAALGGADAFGLLRGDGTKGAQRLAVEHPHEV